MGKQAFSVNGAIAARSAAAAEMEAAVNAGTTWRVLFNGAPYMTCASHAAAVAIVGKSKRMTIVQVAA